MTRKNRSEVFDAGEVGIYHCTQRAVRRAWLCGQDPVSGRSFEHRRGWIEERLEELAAIFAFDALSYAVMSNHVHTLVRNRPDILEGWSNREVALRWWRLAPGRRDADGRAAEPTEAELKPLLTQKRNRKLRERLGSISWLMRYLAEPIARQANKEDQCKGRFWEGRFKCQRLVDEAAVLACSAYVDLNPVRAGDSLTPEESIYTSLYRRIAAWKESLGLPREESPSDDAQGQHEMSESNVANSRRSDDWLAPVGLDERAEAHCGAMPSGSGRRASDKGFLAMSFEAYLELVDWTGRQIRRPDQAQIPSQAAPILERLGLEAGKWCYLVERFGKIFKQAAGGPVALAQEAARRGQRWMQTSGSPLGAMSG
jgi:REP element-mobilizing transposase RayT